MSIPIVSIIIPTYNRTKYLALTLESISLQTCQDFEIIVIDDGSSDDEAKLLCKRYEKVKYIKISNSGGPAKPRNIGIQNSKGRYLAFVDDDDLWMPNKLEKQIEILDNNPDFGLVHSCCEVIDENGVSKDKIVGRPGTLGLKHGDVSLRMIGNWTVMMPTSFVRKEVVSKVGFFNEEIIPALEDVEYWSRCSFETKFFYIDKPLAQYRIHSNNISTDNKKYLHLPLYLKNVLRQQIASEKISKKQYYLLLDNLCKAQITSVKTDILVTFKKLFLLDALWFFRKNNLKMLLYLLVIKK